uniref:Reverse transcriptase domain, reverse transcriptase zinc-binding domain protein n=1 Tax=Tanacetum cinerariifolium TaxID=118510 RepID=A0A699I7G1_TANCI|nr:reverse transcriptase domain, reverse transcriptase zinc-binding domain protein [Tanacetum cinerariifolium]
MESTLRWRFFNSPQALWVKVVSEIHGSCGNVGSVFFHQCGDSGTWARIVETINTMHDKADKDCLVRDRWQNGWVWCWTRNINGGVTGSQLDSLISMLVNVQLIEGQDAWQWSLIGSNIFTVKDTQIYIDSISLPDFPIETRRKGFEVPSLFCPMCNISHETSLHLFWSCPLATSICRSVFKWTDLPLPDSNNQNDAFNWLDDVRLNSASKVILHFIFGVVVWMLWRFRNNKIFEDNKMLQKDLLDQIVDVSFLWFSSRNRNLHVASWGRKNLQYRPEGPGPDEPGYIHNP